VGEKKKEFPKFPREKININFTTRNQKKGRNNFKINKRKLTRISKEIDFFHH
jgi:hypothetical protein